MDTITIAIVDNNPDRRSKLEHALHTEPDIQIMAETTELAEVFSDKPDPRILFINVQQCYGNQTDTLGTLRHEHPDTLVVLLSDDSEEQETQVILGLAKGAKGCLNFDADPIMLSKAVHAIDRGEAWVSRKILGKIMEQKVRWSHGDAIKSILA